MARYSISLNREDLDRYIRRNTHYTLAQFDAAFLPHWPYKADTLYVLVYLESGFKTSLYANNNPAPTSARGLFQTTPGKFPTSVSTVLADHVPALKAVVKAKQRENFPDDVLCLYLAHLYAIRGLYPARFPTDRFFESIRVDELGYPKQFKGCYATAQCQYTSLLDLGDGYILPMLDSLALVNHLEKRLMQAKIGFDSKINDAEMLPFITINGTKYAVPLDRLTPWMAPFGAAYLEKMGQLQFRPVDREKKNNSWGPFSRRLDQILPKLSSAQTGGRGLMMPPANLMIDFETPLDNLKLDGLNLSPIGSVLHPDMDMDVVLTAAEAGIALLASDWNMKRVADVAPIAGTTAMGVDDGKTVNYMMPSGYKQAVARAIVKDAIRLGLPVDLQATLLTAALRVLGKGQSFELLDAPLYRQVLQEDLATLSLDSWAYKVALHWVYEGADVHRSNVVLFYESLLFPFSMPLVPMPDRYSVEQAAPALSLGRKLQHSSRFNDLVDSFRREKVTVETPGTSFVIKYGYDIATQLSIDSSSAVGVRSAKDPAVAWLAHGRRERLADWLHSVGYTVSIAPPEEKNNNIKNV